MSDRKTLTLRPVPYVDAAKLQRTEEIGFRFIERKKRYILQALVVRYEDQIVSAGSFTTVQTVVADRTWVDIPLVPEVYA